MEPSRGFTVRELDVAPGSGDMAAASAVRRAALPHDITLGPEEFPAQLRASSGAHLRRFAAIDGSGRLVGYALAAISKSTDLPGEGRLVLIVHPEQGRRGAGTALADAAEAHLESIGAQIIRSAGPAERAEPFAAGRGYTAGSTCGVLRVDLADIADAPEAPAGVTVRTAVEYEADPRPVYELDIAGIADEPGDWPPMAMPFEQWRSLHWDDPRLDRNLTLIAEADGVPVAMSALHSDREALVLSEVTCTLPAYRGRGIAGFLKTAVLCRARDAGLAAAITENDSGNAPMLAINRRIGYRRVGTETLFKRPLPR
ncbi:GNAT family N-acetyltransferase [Nocardiopsis coralliicola]